MTQPHYIDREAELVPIRLGGSQPMPSINLRDLGFVGTVSDEARAEILALDRRAAMVLTTSHRFWFR